MLLFMARGVVALPTVVLLPPGATGVVAGPSEVVLCGRVGVVAMPRVVVSSLKIGVVAFLAVVVKF